MALARILRPAKTAMQSGRAKTQKWVLEYEQATQRVPDPLMGWSSAADTLNQVSLRFDTLEEAIAIGNETEFGLTAAVFTNNLNDAWLAASELRHGTVHINETTNYWDQMAPFGGAKSSGSGRELADGIADALTETKQITFDRG